MLKRPSARRKTKGEQIELNLVPIIDTMVTLIGFLLFTMAFLQLVTIESPFPEASQAEQQEKLKEKPLQLTVSLREDEAEIWSPFDRVQAKKIPNINPGMPDLLAIHAALIEVKKKFPNENRVVIVPFAAANYETLVTLMDAIRMMDPTDPPIFAKNAVTGIDEPVKTLFPNLIFGNLLGDN